MNFLERKNATRQALAGKIDDLQRRLYKIDTELDKYKIQWVLERGILKESLWRIEKRFGLVGQNPLVLTSHCKKHKNLADILQNDYHCSQAIADGVMLRFDDWDISLMFGTTQRGLEFIKEYGLKTNIEDFKLEYEERKKELNSLGGFLKSLEIKRETKRKAKDNE